MNKKRKLLIFYDWFYPGFRAGGPIQSLSNLAIALSSKFDIYVITSAYDLNSDIPYVDIISDSWNEVMLPSANAPIKVYYGLKHTFKKKRIGELVAEVSPYSAYLNGIFSYSFFQLPLSVLRKINPEIKVVICPRGMLKAGALSGKALKKQIYLQYLNLSGLLNNVYWHATTIAEQGDIYKHFGRNKGVYVAPNIPKKPFSNIANITKETGELKLVYLSLINEHKNLQLLLRVLKGLSKPVTLKIYGPIIDEDYWKNCIAQINEMSDNVKYMGAVEPSAVQTVISENHVFILLTKGENFGHALYESLSVGRPVITSEFTPWQNLRDFKAGANIKLEEEQSIVKAINEFIEMRQEEYNLFCKGAHSLATNYYKNLRVEESYQQLFS